MSFPLVAVAKYTEDGTARDWMSGIAERQYQTATFLAADGRHYTMPRENSHVQIGEVAQIVYMVSRYEAWKATPEQIAGFGVEEVAA